MIPVSALAVPLVTGVLLVPPASALQTTVHDVGGVVEQRWTVDDGLPLDHINDLDLGPDGRLWMATVEGLWTFDGARIERVALDLPSVRIYQARRDPRSGTLWLITESGLVSVDGDRAHAWNASGDLDEQPFGFVTAWGRLLMSTNQGLLDLSDRPRPHLRAVLSGDVRSLAVDGDDALWIDFADGRLLIEDIGGHVTPAPPGAPAVPRMLFGLRDGGVWVGNIQGDPATAVWDERGWHRGPPGSYEGPLACTTNPLAWRVPCAPTGGSDGPWTVGGRVVRWRGELIRELDLDPRAAVQDAGGDLWVATRGEGLLRFREPAVQVAWPGVPDRRVTGTFGDAGVLWLSSPEHGWWRAGPDGLQALALAPSADGWTQVDYVARRADGVLVGDQAGSRIVELPEGLGVDADTPVRPVTQWAHGVVTASARTDDGALWLGADTGLLIGTETGWSEHEASRGRPISALMPLPDGGVLAAIHGEGLARASADGDLELLDPRPELREVRDLRVDRDRTWVSTTSHGLCAWTGADAPLRCVDADAGLPAAGAHASVVDGRGRTWISTNRGLVVTTASALAAFADGDAGPPTLFVLGVAEGLPVAECNGGTDLALRLDGSLLRVATQGGAVTVDTAAFSLPPPPPVSLAPPVVDGEVLDGPLPPEHGQVVLSWSAPGLDWGSQVRFRSRVAGGPWSPPSSRRSLTLPHLPPGRSLIEVQAGLAGTWGPIASTSIARSPRLRERPAFYQALGILAVLAVVGIARVRQRRIRRLADALAAEVDAKTREISTQRDQIATQARDLEGLAELRTRMIVNLHHELRTPLALILGALDVGDADHLDLARKTGRRLGELVDQLDDIAHLDAGDVHVVARNLDLGATVRRIAERFVLLARERHITLDVSQPVDVVAVFADPDLLDKAVGNLIHNALKFTPEGGSVRVALHALDDRVRVEVDDSGVGVPPAERERIFERLYQVDRGDERAFEGSGLGLAMVREIVGLHGGDVGCIDSELGGSRFFIELPLGTGHLEPDDVAFDEGVADWEVHTLPEVAVVGDAPLVLVVEDHPDMRAFLAQSLIEGCRVQTASDGAQALTLMRQERPAVVVSDVMMAGMDGLSMLRELRADPALADIPVLVVTARSRPVDRTEALQLADVVLAKPFYLPELRAQVRRLLARPPAGPVAEPPGQELPAADRDVLQRLEDTLEARLGDAALKVDDLAYGVGMSQRTLQRELSRILGVSPSTWIRERRLLRAQQMMRAGEFRTVSEVAAAVGMSRSYFTKAYRAWSGRAPSDELG